MLPIIITDFSQLNLAIKHEFYKKLFVRIYEAVAPNFGRAVCLNFGGCSVDHEMLYIFTYFELVRQPITLVHMQQRGSILLQQPVLPVFHAKCLSFKKMIFFQNSLKTSISIKFCSLFSAKKIKNSKFQDSQFSENFWS